MKLNLESVGEIIAERKLVLSRDGHAPTEIQVLMGKPQNLLNHPDYYCPYQLKGFGDEKVRAAWGVDAFQAMQLAMGTIGVQLEVMGRESGGTIAWDAGVQGDLGFPISH